MPNTQHPPVSTTEMWETTSTGLRIAAQMAQGISPYGKDADRIRTARNALASLRTRMDDLQRDYDFDTHALQDELETAHARRRIEQDRADSFDRDGRRIRAALAKAEQERDEARELVKHYITKHDAVVDEFQALRAKLTKAEAVIEAAREIQRDFSYMGSNEIRVMSPENLGRLQSALASYDQEEEAHG